MTDPFQQSTDAKKFIREAQVGLLIIALLLVYFAYVAYYRTEKYRSQLPQYVLDAPIAKRVDPDVYLQGIQTNRVAIEPNEPPIAGIPASAETPSEAFGAARETTPPGLPMPTVPTPPAVLAKTEAAHSQTAKLGDAKYDNQLRSPVKSENDSFVVQAARNEPVLPPDSAPRQNQSQAAYDIADAVTFSPRELTPLAAPYAADDELVTTAAINDNSFQPTARPPRELNPDVMKADPPKPDEFTKSMASHAAASETGPKPLAAQPLPAATLDQPLLVDDQSEPPDPESDSSVESLSIEVVDSGKSKTAEQTKHADAPAHANRSQTSNPPGKYLVKHGDSYWSIAQELYGDGRFFRALFEHNRSRLIEFENLDAGTEINAPAADLLVIRYPDLCPPDKVNARRTVESGDVNSVLVYETRQGDTLFDVARKQLGQASRYLEILKLNNQQLPSNITHLSKLRAGIRLDLPQ